MGVRECDKIYPSPLKTSSSERILKGSMTRRDTQWIASFGKTKEAFRSENAGDGERGQVFADRFRQGHERRGKGYQGQASSLSPMIEFTRKRLTAIFTSVIIVFSLLVLGLSLIVLRQSLMRGVEEHLTKDIRDEYLDHYLRFGLSFLHEMPDENHFQILNRAGNVVVSARDSVGFDPGLNNGLLAAAFDGKQGFETRTVGKVQHLVSYFPLDQAYAGRAAVSLEMEAEQERNFLRMALMLSPLMLVLSYLASRYLLSHAMKPISDVFTFQETFLSSINHELRSPLASKKGNFEVALRRVRSTDEYREVIESGLRETDRMINFLRNFSLLASSKFKPLDLYKKRANIDQIIQDLVVSYTPAIDAKRISLDIAQTSGISCVCDPDLIRRTIENLLDNAVKYTPDGGSIKVSLSRKKRKIFFTISNTCEPIEKKELENLFEPFYRAETSRLSAEGKGLGLYIVNYIVRSHGGDILLNKTDDKLFSLTVTLPA